jgi:hypothetical protein
MKLMDPVKSCELYREEGCSHVDGFLCDGEVCQMRLDHVLQKSLLRSSKVVDKGFFASEPPEKKF